MQTQGWMECRHCGGTGTCERGDAYFPSPEPDARAVRRSCPECLKRAGVDSPFANAQVPCSVCGGAGKYWLEPPPPGQHHPLAYRVVSTDLAPLRELADSINEVLTRLSAIEERQVEIAARVDELIQAGAPVLVEPGSNPGRAPGSHRPAARSEIEGFKASYEWARVIPSKPTSQPIRCPLNRVRGVQGQPVT